MKTKSKYLQEASIDELMSSFNFVIPEIQREYVWGHNEREILDIFFHDLKANKKNDPDNDDLDKQIEILRQKGKLTKESMFELVSDYEKDKTINIGFLYSYEPNYHMEHFPQSDIFRDVYLIDGQQRFTTLFLLLFYLSIKENIKDEFISLFRFNKEIETVAFDYRVRSLTHNFIIDLIGNISNLYDIDNMEQKTWFLASYKKDPTVNAMVKALKIITIHFNESDNYFDYIKDNVKFWHFKTEKTNQGEELYITMNSRGKQLEDNEELRSILFSKLTKEEELKYSEKWEMWQDFFWKHRDKKEVNSSADKGFNEFLRCIAGLEALKRKSKDFLKLNESISVNKLNVYIDLHVIEQYFEALKFLHDNKDAYKSYYDYCNWVDDCYSVINDMLFKKSTNWFIDYTDDNRANERRNMLFIWSIFHFMVSKMPNELPELLELLRLLRIYWIRYNNYERGVSTLLNRCNKIIEEGIWTLSNTTPDEQSRHAFLDSIKDKNTLRQYESAIWKIEDHPLNINGYQVKLQNITHLIDFNSELTIDELNYVYEKFIALFGDNSARDSRLNTILLYYGNYGRQVSPYYYDNWDFSRWGRIIRDLDNDKKIFKQFFNDYDGSNLDEILIRKQKEFAAEIKGIVENANENIEIKDLINCLRLYSLIHKNIWKHGKHIAVDYAESENCLTKYEADKTLYNTQGNFRGYKHVQLITLIKYNNKTNKELIDEVKEIISKHL